MKRTTTSATDRAAIRQLLNHDPVWAAYGLADLQPAFAPHCQWYTSNAAADATAAGVLLLFTALEPPILLTVGAPTAIATLLAEATLPAQVFISARHAHVPLIEQYYRFDRPAQGTSFEQMLRMALHDPAVLADVALTQVRRLGPADAPQIEALLTHGGPFTPDAFEAYQLNEGVFFGLDGADGELIAVGGTHIVDWHEGVGAVGNMYTHPAARGRGYGRLILGAIVKTLYQGGVHNIVLNVNTKNTTARRLYEQYGFVIHCEFAEGIGIKRDVSAVEA
jgi:ribosomal protein S18 acetylase RimI-like enzyme